MLGGALGASTLSLRNGVSISRVASSHRAEEATYESLVLGLMNSSSFSAGDASPGLGC